MKGAQGGSGPLAGVRRGSLNISTINYENGVTIGP